MAKPTKLLRGVSDSSMVPKTGNLDRLYVSRFKLGQGVDYTATCTGGTKMESPCTGRYLGQIQPYALYVPDKPLPAKGFGLVVSMHGLSANYNEFLGSHEASQMAERGRGSIFASPEGRGPDGSWKEYAEADVFEMWNDIARHYRLDPSLTDVTGYSMGGGGTYTLGSEWPDLWARAFPIVGPPSSSGSFANFRNIPVMAWYGQNDELVGPELSEEAFLNATNAGIRYDHWLFTPAGHVTEGNNDQYAPAAAFLGSATVDRDPYHVTYYYDPATNDPLLGPADHAYWLSAIALRSSSSAGQLDVRSLASGLGDPPVEAPAVGYHVLNGGSHGPIPYQERNLTWGSAPHQARSNELVIKATNVASVRVDASRAGVTCAAKLDVTSDGPLAVKLVDCPAPPPRFACPRAAGTITARALGALRLGMSRVQARRKLIAEADRARPDEDFFCLTPIGIRAGYAPARLLGGLPARARRALLGRVVWISTANPFYADAGVRPGAAIVPARRRLKLGGVLRVGVNDWYFAARRGRVVVIKARHGRVDEIGIADPRVSATRRLQEAFLRVFS